MPLTRGGFRHYDYDRMVVRKWHAQFSPAAMDDLDGSTRRYPSPHRWSVPYVVTLKSGLGEGQRPSGRTVRKLTASQLCLLKRGGSVELVAIGLGTRKMVMPKQKLHAQEEVFKDHVSGQYDETIHFVSESRAAGFIRTLLSGLVRSIKAM